MTKAKNTNKFGGFLLLDKPIGITSFDLVSKIKEMFPKQKVGHLGTLDPLATGLMIVTIGSHTKLMSSFVKEDKEYIAKIKLGAFSKTDDLEGIDKNTRYNKVDIDKKEIEEYLKTIIGTQEQTPPIYSAKSINGQRAYKLAREGKEVKLKSQTIEIHCAKLINFQNGEVEVKLKVSSGTYIRSIARKMGEDLATGAHLSGLRRTKIGKYMVEDAKTLDNLTFLDIESKQEQPKSIFSIGKFDGIHKGHITLLEENLKIKQDSEISISVILDTNNKYLTSIYDRVGIMNKLGIDLVIVQKFNNCFKNMTSDEFITCLKDKYNMKMLVGGENQIIGKDKKKPNIHIQNLPNVSSSEIKDTLSIGNIEKTNELLNKDFSIRGKVVEGKKIGKTIGFPTANIDYQNYFLPKEGVYSGIAILNHKEYKTIISISNNPTVSNDNKITVEAHLLNYNKKDFYYKYLTIKFKKYMRPITKFKNLEELKCQLNKDKNDTISL